MQRLSPHRCRGGWGTLLTASITRNSIPTTGVICPGLNQHKNGLPTPRRPPYCTTRTLAGGSAAINKANSEQSIRVDDTGGSGNSPLEGRRGGNAGTPQLTRLGHSNGEGESNIDYDANHDSGARYGHGDIPHPSWRKRQTTCKY